MLQGEVKIALLCARWIAALSCQLHSHCPSLADLFRLFSLTILFPLFFFAIIPPWWRDGGAEATETSGSLKELGEGRIGVWVGYYRVVRCGVTLSFRVTEDVILFLSLYFFFLQRQNSHSVNMQRETFRAT